MSSLLTWTTQSLLGHSCSSRRRWVSPWLELDLHGPRLRWICALTDPLINALRRALPPMGPMDFGPLAALFVVWVVRALSVGIVAGAAMHG